MREERGAGGKPYIPALNGFRAFAILGIVVFHVLALSAPPDDPGRNFDYLVWGWLSGLLDTFFIVSGCVLFLPIVARGGMGDVGDWIRKRGARLFPSYWVTLTLALVLLLFVGQATPVFPSALEVILQYAALPKAAHVFDPGFPIGFGDGPLWMIGVVLGLYVLLVLFWRPYLRHPLIGLGVAAAITVTWKLLAANTGLFEAIEGGNSTALIVQLAATEQVPGWLYSFALGMTCAWAYVRFAKDRPREELQRFALRLAPFAIAGFLVCSVLYSNIAIDAPAGVPGGSVSRSHVFLTLTFTTFRAAVMAVIVLGPVWLAWPFTNRAARKLAELSYGIYLVHILVAIYVCSIWLELPQDGSIGTAALWLAVVLPPSILYAVLLQRFVEGPARAWAARRKPETAPSSARQPEPRPATP